MYNASITTSGLPDILAQIIQAKVKQLEIQKDHKPLSDFTSQLCLRAVRENTDTFSSALKSKTMGIIAEVKKASPSKGVITENFDPTNIALKYEQGGAAAISVLTEEDYFLGSTEVLKQVKTAVKCPILRKDFIIDPYQIYESAVIGADAILLIARLLDLETLRSFIELSYTLGMEVLLEIHNLEDLRKAVLVDAPIIGVNNRNLSTFKVHIETSLDLVKHLPKGKLWISESGIQGVEEIQRLKQVGFQGVLIGETLMRCPERLSTFTQI